MTTLREQILGAQDIARETVPCPEWGTDIVLHGLTARARFQIVARFSDDSGKVSYEDLYPALVVACAHAPDSDELLFTDEDLDAIAGKSATPVERLGQAAMRISGIGTGKTDKQGDPVTPADDEGKAS